jgi:hypothetical protein
MASDLTRVGIFMAWPQAERAGEDAPTGRPEHRAEWR